MSTGIMVLSFQKNTANDIIPHSVAQLEESLPTVRDVAGLRPGHTKDI